MLKHSTYDSPAAAVVADGLTKRYGDRTVVSGLSFSVSPGRVTGFLGPNGAGKTQTLKMILGLVHPSQGTATIQGRPLLAHSEPARVVGAVLDGGAFNYGRTARSTLRISALIAGVGEARVEELLARVGLDDDGDRRVGEYSLGMRQRLALAQALLADPAVLIADEPANGLDPGGIVWLRGLLGELAERGKTVLVSSHLLSEAERLVDDVVIVEGGRLVAAGPLAEVAGLDGGLERRFLELTGGGVR
ncbi:MAG TPA: ATP-binding cassette domain-containing protein [Solirubrobacteraceae bacterium]|jgi:ABC-2 type transport system ATP-binding protein|nr:ATP-binding cassette domain-containing protein [Solirubrobacteraceae bacterium]